MQRKYGKPRWQAAQWPQARFGAGTTRSPGSSGVPSPAYAAAPSPTASTIPTFSWPWISGYVAPRCVSLPGYCSTSPRNVCLSVPQIPEAIIRSSTAPGSSSVGYG